MKGGETEVPIAAWPEEDAPGGEQGGAEDDSALIVGLLGRMMAGEDPQTLLKSIPAEVRVSLIQQYLPPEIQHALRGQLGSDDVVDADETGDEEEDSDGEDDDGDDGEDMVSNTEILNSLGAAVQEFLGQFPGLRLGITFTGGKARVATFYQDDAGEYQTVVAKRAPVTRLGDMIVVAMEDTADRLSRIEDDDEEGIDDDSEE